MNIVHLTYIMLDSLGMTDSKEHFCTYWLEREEAFFEAHVTGDQQIPVAAMVGLAGRLEAQAHMVPQDTPVAAWLYSLAAELRDDAKELAVWSTVPSDSGSA